MVWICEAAASRRDFFSSRFRGVRNGPKTTPHRVRKHPGHPKRPRIAAEPPKTTDMAPSRLYRLPNPPQIKGTPMRCPSGNTHSCAFIIFFGFPTLQLSFFPAFEDSPRGSTYTAHMRPARPRAQRRNNKKKPQMTPKKAPGSKGEGVRVRVFGIPCESAGVQHRVHALGCSGFRVCWFTLLGSGADVRWLGSGVRHCVFRFWS